MRRGWCPGLYEPMPTADGLLVRLRPPNGWLDGARLQALCRGSVAFGNGQIELTGQGRLQVRGLAEGSVGRFAQAMTAAGLASADPAVEARRRVTILPDGDRSLGAQIEQALIGWDGPLAPKFDVVMGIDGVPPADITLHGNLLWIAGARTAASCHDPVQAVLRLAGRLGGERMRALVEAHGEEAIYRDAGLSGGSPVPVDASDPIGPGCVGLVFGRLDPVLIARLGRHGDGVWRLTRDRVLRLEGVRDPSALAAEAAQAGLITDGDDPRRRIAACAGQAGCASGSVDARTDALALIAALPAGARLHVAGCAKGCAHPASSSITLVGVDGRYDLVRHGRANDVPIARGLGLAAARDALRAVGP